MTELVGILNLTPDSFSDGGAYIDVDRAEAHYCALLRDGAAFVDIGAESTRPGATAISPDEEWRRLLPLLQRLHDSTLISLDTYHPETVRRAAELLPRGFIVNDVTGLKDRCMQETIAELQLHYIASHSPSADIQAGHRNPAIDSVHEVVDDLLSTVDAMKELGLPDSFATLDPGYGFGKTPRLNRELLGFGQHVKEFDVMIGYSRKRSLGPNRMELAPNLEAGRIAIAGGARYLRVHDVAGHRQLLRANY